jgi:hypothetical protein
MSTPLTKLQELLDQTQMVARRLSRVAATYKHRGEKLSSRPKITSARIGKLENADLIRHEVRKLVIVMMKLMRSEVLSPDDILSLDDIQRLLESLVEFSRKRVQESSVPTPYEVARRELTLELRKRDLRIIRELIRFVSDNLSTFNKTYPPSPYSVPYLE